MAASWSEAKGCFLPLSFTINPVAVAKLSDRTSVHLLVVTDVGLFLSLLVQQLD
ncbi:hypothetical protein [Gloeocapsopsis dulcis]|uniref:hypothetical protein n=1 Tax=Gloeocapsopsis dulcis TaxID=2859516 RepID=UPI0012DA9827|nr:hypothetical protein [Gloeocapsopsis dulcis]WNN88922.1 hypothetical protein P0S91_22090 [Gloeocapsopsis dulcis]